MRGLLVVLGCLGAQAELERAREALAEGDYHSAWEAIAAEPDELARYLGYAEVLYAAGDPTGALDAARAGLALDPTNIDLLYHAARASIWMEDPASASAHSDRLLRSVETVEGWSSEQRRDWLEAAEDLVARSEAMAVRERQLDRTLRSLQTAALGGVALWLCLSGYVLRSQGRSSKPVS